MSSDQGLSLLRVLLQRQLDAIAPGRRFGWRRLNESGAYVKFDAGQFLDD